MELLQFLPWYHLAESSLPLVLNVFLEQGYSLVGARRWVRSSRNGGLDDLPGPVGPAIHLNSMPPLLQGWRERVHVCQRLRLHE